MGYSRRAVRCDSGKVQLMIYASNSGEFHPSEWPLGCCRVPQERGHASPVLQCDKLYKERRKVLCDFRNERGLVECSAFQGTVTVFAPRLGHRACVADVLRLKNVSMRNTAWH